MRRKIPIIVLLALSLLNLARSGGPLSELRQYTYESYWEANAAHIVTHPTAVVFTLCQVALPILLCLSLLNVRAADIAAMAVMGYVPLFVAYGTFVTTRAGFSPSPLMWLCLLIIVILVEAALWWHVRGLPRPANPGVEPDRNA